MTSPTAAGLLSVEAARDAVLAVAEPVGTERIQTADALGRVTAETVTARVSLPPWANSAMDGYAIRAADTLAASEDAPVQLEVVGDIAAGAAPDVTRDARHAPPGSRPARSSRQAPMRSCRSRRRRRSMPPVDSGRAVAMPRARCRPPAWSTNGSSRAARSERPAAT